MRLNYMWSQPLFPSPKKPSPFCHTPFQLPIMGSCAFFRIWMVFPLACCPLALWWLPGYHRLWLVLPGLPRWRQNFQRRRPCRWRTGPKGRMGMGMAWHGRGAILKHLEKNQIRRRTFVQFLKLIGCDKCFPVYIMYTWRPYGQVNQV